MLSAAMAAFYSLTRGQETGVPLSAVTRAKLEMTDALIEEHQRAQQSAEQAH